jgi:hypothetical protein
MGTLAQEIQAAVQKRPGVTDRWLAEMLFGPGAPQQRVNGECRRMADLGLLDRTPRPDGLIGNYCTGKTVVAVAVLPPAPLANDAVFSEDQLKAILARWLEAQGWVVEVAWGKTRGIDLHAQRRTGGSSKQREADRSIR